MKKYIKHIGLAGILSGLLMLPGISSAQVAANTTSFCTFANPANPSQTELQACLVTLTSILQTLLQQAAAMGTTLTLPPVSTSTPQVSGPISSISLNTGSLNFSVTAGSLDPAPQYVTLTSNVPWTASPAASWLTLSPVNGTGSTFNMTIWASASNQSVGTYTSHIDFKDGTGKVVTSLPVTFTVNQSSVTNTVPPPSTNSGQASLSLNGSGPYTFTVIKGNDSNVFGSLGFTNAGNATANNIAISETGFTIASFENTPPKSLAPGAGYSTLFPMNAASNLSALSPGTYNGIITVSGSNFASVQVPVIITVLASTPLTTTITPSPSSLSITAQQGATAASVPYYSFINYGAVAAQSVTMKYSAPWVGTVTTKAPLGQIDAGGSFYTSPSSVNVSSLAPGSYAGTISVSGSNFPTATIPVTLTVTAAASVATTTTLSASPTSLSFASTVGVAPASQTITVTNTGGVVANGSAFVWGGDSASTITPANFSIAPGASQTFKVALAASSNTRSQSNNVAFQNGNFPTVNVGYTYVVTGVSVAAPVATTTTLSASPTSLSFATTQGANPPTQGFSFSNAGNITATGVKVSYAGTLFGSVPVTYFNDMASGSSQNVTSINNYLAAVNGTPVSQFQPGTYAGTITVSGNNFASITIPVTLTVTPMATPVSTTTTAMVTVDHTSFNLTTNVGAWSAAQYLHITASAPVTVTVTETGGALGSQEWLANGNMTPPYNIFPISSTSTVQPYIQGYGLATGTYTATITISGNFSNSPINIPVTLTVTSGGSPYDYNNDGVVNSSDVNYLLTVVTNIQSCPVGKICDVNGDGAVNTLDILALQKIISTQALLSPSSQTTQANASVNVPQLANALTSLGGLLSSLLNSLK